MERIGDALLIRMRAVTGLDRLANNALLPESMLPGNLTE